MLYQNKWRKNHKFFYDWWFAKDGIKWYYWKRTCYLKKNWKRKTCSWRSSWSRKKSCWSSCSRWGWKGKACWSKEKNCRKVRSCCRKTSILTNLKSRIRKRRRIYRTIRRRINLLRIFGVGDIRSEYHCCWIWRGRNKPYFCSF